MEQSTRLFKNLSHKSVLGDCIRVCCFFVRFGQVLLEEKLNHLRWGKLLPAAAWQANPATANSHRSWLWAVGRWLWTSSPHHPTLSPSPPSRTDDQKNYQFLSEAQDVPVFPTKRLRTSSRLFFPRFSNFAKSIVQNIYNHVDICSTPKILTSWQTIWSIRPHVVVITVPILRSEIATERIIGVMMKCATWYNCDTTGQWFVKTI